MKKKLFFFFFFCFFWALEFSLFFVSPTLAFDPIIIKKSEYRSPPKEQSGTEDVNYRPNDVVITDPNVIKCPGPDITLEARFDPKRKQTLTGIDLHGFVYKDEDDPYPVRDPEIKNEINTQNIPYSNRSPENTLIHLGNRSKSLTNFSLTNPNLIDNPQKAFYSFDLNSPDGTSNMANRSTPSKVLNCLKGQRLVKAIQSLDPKSNNTTCNEQIAWSCQLNIVPGSLAPPAIISVARSPIAPFANCSPIRLFDLAMTFVPFGTPVFQRLDVDCQNPNAPPLVAYKPSLITYLLNLSETNYNPVLFLTAIDLFKNGVEITDNCSIARKIEACDYNYAAKTLECDPISQKDVSIPLGSILYTASNAIDQTIPKTQNINQVDICQTSPKQINSKNIPNPVTIKTQITKVSGHVSEGHPLVVKATTKINYYIDKGIQDSLNKIQTFNKNLISYQDQKTNNLDNLAGSSTNGYNVDPGNDQAGVIARRSLLPAKWQSPLKYISVLPIAYKPGTSLKQWCPYINKYSQEAGISPDIIVAVINQESGGDYSVIGSDGCGSVGLMQIIAKDFKNYPSPIRNICPTEFGENDFPDRPTGAELLIPEKNIQTGVGLIKTHLKENYNSDDMIKALIAYNGGKSYGELITNSAAANPNFCSSPTP